MGRLSVSTGRAIAILLVAVLANASCGGRESPTGPIGLLPGSSPPPTATPVPTPTPPALCIASATPITLDSDHAKCPVGRTMITIGGNFSLTAAANADIQILKIAPSGSWEFNFSPEQVRAGRTERINIHLEFECINTGGGKPGNIPLAPYRLTTGCGTMTLQGASVFTLE